MACLLAQASRQALLANLSQSEKRPCNQTTRTLPCATNKYDAPRSALERATLFHDSRWTRFRVSYPRYASQDAIFASHGCVRSGLSRRDTSTVPCFEARQEYKEVLLLIAEVVSQRRFPSELGLQVTDLNDQSFTLLFVLVLEFIELAVIAATDTVLKSI